MRHRARSGAIMLAAAAALVIFGNAAASAQAAEPMTDNDQIVLHGTLDVPQGETVDSAVIFDGPATVEGTVTESLVVFNGDVEISGTIQKDVVVFNGDVVLRSGAVVQGDVVSQSDAQVEQGATLEGQQQTITTEVDAGAIGFASRIAWWIGYSVSTLILGVVLLLLAPGLDGALTRVGRTKLGASIGFGALAFFGVPIVSGLLLVTVVGIPLGLFFLLALALIYTVGYVAGVHVLGRYVMKDQPSRYVPFLIGWAIARGLALIPFLGGIVWFVLTMVGLGAALLAARARSDASPSVTAPAAPPPMPASADG
jgi:cytoskeletal protein CcmA (bactofilin family)